MKTAVHNVGRASPVPFTEAATSSKAIEFKPGFVSFKRSSYRFCMGTRSQQCRCGPALCQRS